MADLNIRPLDNRVVVIRMEEENKSAGGIVIPDTAKEKPIRGKVVAVGPGKMKDDGNRCELSIKADDIVLFGKYAGTDVTLSGTDYLVLREDDILGIIE